MKIQSLLKFGVGLKNEDGLFSYFVATSVLNITKQNNKQNHIFNVYNHKNIRNDNKQHHVFIYKPMLQANAPIKNIRNDATPPTMQ